MYATVPTVWPVCVTPSVPASLASLKSRILTHTARGDQQIGGLDVTMHDARSMRIRESPADLLRGDVDGVAHRQRPPLDPLLQRLPLVVRHHEVELAVVGLVDLVDRANVRVVQGRGRLRLLEEPLLRGVVAGQIGREHLDRHLAVEARICAVYTIPIPPRPSSARIAYGPRVEPGASVMGEPAGLYRLAGCGISHRADVDRQPLESVLRVSSTVLRTICSDFVRTVRRPVFWASIAYFRHRLLRIGLSRRNARDGRPKGRVGRRALRRGAVFPINP